VTTSQILFLTGVACGVLFAGCAVYHQVAQLGVAWRAVSWRIPVWAVVLCTAFGALAFALDSGVANRTLFEDQVAGTGDTAPAVLTFTVPVEHPGARHEFMVDPRDDGGDVDGPIDVEVKLTDPTGATLADERQTLDTRDDSGSSGIRHEVWDDWNRELTPTRAGDHVLSVTVLSPQVPEVHVWVGDDDKTDGHRIAGY
jgi:hypothetical protein